jgi:hypothetical protein
MDLEVVRLLSRVRAFYEEEHQLWILLLCLFTSKHVLLDMELQNVAKKLMDQSHDQKRGILIIHNRLRGMELGG